MKKYKINREKEDFKVPSKKTIYKYKNFNKIQVSYKDITQKSGKPLYKNRKLFLFIVLLMLLLYIIANSELF